MGFGWEHGPGDPSICVELFGKTDDREVRKVEEWSFKNAVTDRERFFPLFSNI